jgi:hypothetical protein
MLSGLFLSVLASAASADPVLGPPMNASNSAYYVCASGSDAFVINYVGPKLDQASIQSNTNKVYKLHRTPVSSGYMFTDGKGVQFWTDGKRVSLTGTVQAYTNCQLHTS